MAETFSLRLRDGTVRAFPRPTLMGILNATPDSFFDGDPQQNKALLLARLDRMVHEGVALVDLGGESTRPGATPVPLLTELDRVIPLLRHARKEYPGLLISIDTTKAAVADAALQEGADLINDTSAGEDSEGLLFESCARAGCPLILMHRNGRPDSMQDNPVYGDVVAEVCAALAGRARLAQAAGIRRDRIVLDPGIGFGKLEAHNLALLRGLPALKALGYPVLVGASMKRVVGDLTGRPTAERLPGTLGLHLAASLLGADLLRLHEPWAMKDALIAFRALIPQEV
ncbi:MAG: dihydropteroate synthase [Spirochaetes bacterium]|nr:dihydropteroate synthase [Spirochaetota bacterium]